MSKSKPEADGGEPAPILKRLFIVSPIGDENSEIRIHADDFRKYIVRKTAEPMGYECVRADDINKSGLIDQQIIDRLMNDDIVVADLTGHNPNVFYELAIRHAAQLPFIHMISEGHRIPADIATNRAIFFDLKNPRSIEKACNDLEEHILSIKGGEKTASPFSTYKDIRQVQTTGSDEEKNLASLVTQLAQSVAEIRSATRTSAAAPRQSVSNESVLMELERLLNQKESMQQRLSRLYDQLQSGNSDKEFLDRVQSEINSMASMIGEVTHSINVLSSLRSTR